MQQSSLVKECENYRRNVMLSIDNLDITEEQKQLFLMNHQAFYLQLLQKLFRTSESTDNSITLAEIVN
jgi:hypothetical protein